MASNLFNLTLLLSSLLFSQMLYLPTTLILRPRSDMLFVLPIILTKQTFFIGSPSNAKMSQKTY